MIQWLMGQGSVVVGLLGDVDGILEVFTIDWPVHVENAQGIWNGNGRMCSCLGLGLRRRGSGFIVGPSYAWYNNKSVLLESDKN